MKLLYIGVFGVLGVYSRYGISLLLLRALPPTFPYGTFFINLAGAFAIGLVYVCGVERQAISDELRVGVSVGFLGGFTTFSAYCLESGRLLETGETRLGLLYYLLSPVLGLLFTFAGQWIGRYYL